ncbi:transcriptional activator FtrB [Roseovarius sp. A-2]|uniref:helix-turn-helix domain-containing protein n=1 Tax=Roseovarius sp. A-2 TaxID=1570360 RepID=UPI0009B51189|nr:helix-turn-helix domain-containing protein [Roseovarius sp. A-2]GAW36661.1 transcriptional activator FtrB [Roseovarius sp. A-2]
MPDSVHEEIRKLHLFDAMAVEHFQTLMRGAFVQTFPPLVDLITEGDPSDFLHVLISGSVDLFSAWNDRETSLATVRPVSTFILAATIRDQPYLMSARTLEKSRIALIPSAEIRRIFDADSDFARAIVTELALCYRSVVKAQKNLKLRTSSERLANYLLRAQARAGGQAEFELGFEKRRLASVLGMTPEHLSRAFKGLQPHGVVATAMRVGIAEPDKLKRFARPNPLIDDPKT